MDGITPWAHPAMSARLAWLLPRIFQAAEAVAVKNQRVVLRPSLTHRWRGAHLLWKESAQMSFTGWRACQP